MVFFFCFTLANASNKVLLEASKKTKEEIIKNKVRDGAIEIESLKMKRVRSIFKT